MYLSFRRTKNPSIILHLPETPINLHSARHFRFSCRFSHTLQNRTPLYRPCAHMLPFWQGMRSFDIVLLGIEKLAEDRFHLLKLQ